MGEPCTSYVNVCLQYLHLRDYTKKLEDESKQWSKFLLDRNRLLKQADSNQKEAQAGSIKVCGCPQMET